MMDQGKYLDTLPLVPKDTILIYFSICDFQKIPLSQLDSFFTQLFCLNNNENPLNSYLFVIGDVESGNSPTQLIQILSSTYGISAKIHYRIFKNPLFYFSIIFHPYCGYNPVMLGSLNKAIIYSKSSFVASFPNHKATSLSIFFKSYMDVLNSNPALDDVDEDGNSNHFGTVKFTRYYDNVILGGTFDHLHVGHKFLLSQAALISSRAVLCGVSGNVFV